MGHLISKIAKLVVVGSLNMDLVVRVAHLPAQGETILGGEFHTIPGGKGANQAVAAARLGAEVTMVGRVGNDGFGQALHTNLAGEEIDVTHLRTDPAASTGVALITVDQHGQNTIVVVSGANMCLMPAEVEQALTQIGPFDVAIMQLESPIECVETAARLARQAGARTILNPAPARLLPVRLLEQIDFLVPNETEASLLSGVDISEIEGAEHAARVLISQGVRSVVITLGGKGALLVAGKYDAPVHFPAYPVDVVDTTAAGDAFVAGLAVGLGEGMPLQEAVQLGSAAGALSVTRLGAQPSLPTRREVSQLLGKAA
jgi:ribokinase